MKHDRRGWEGYLSALPLPSPFFILYSSFFILHCLLCLVLLCVLGVSVVHLFWTLLVCDRRRLVLGEVLAVPLVPGNRFDEALAEARFRLEAEGALRPRRVQTAARLSIGFARIPADLSLERTQLANLLR